MKKSAWGVLIVIILIGGYLLFSKKSAAPVATNTEPIKIGAVLSLTGAAAPWGEYGKKAIDLAVKQINATGGVNGRRVEAIIEDDHTDGKEGVSAFNKLQSIDKVQGVIGGVFDFTAQPLMPLAHNEKIAFISPSNFRIAGGFELNDQSFVMLPDFNKVIKGLTTYLEEQKVKKLAVVHFKSTFGNEIAKTLDEVMKSLGTSGIVEEEYTQIGGNDFRTIIAKLKNAGVDAVFLDTLGSDSVNFLTRSKQADFKPTFMSYNGLTDAFANESDKSVLENVVILDWELSSPTFTKLFKDAYGIEPGKSADKYFDAVYVLANAIAHTDDPSKVAAYIESNTFTTLNGTVAFPANHTPSNTPVQIEVIKNGVRVPWQS